MGFGKEREGGYWEEFELEIMYRRPKPIVTHANEDKGAQTTVTLLYAGISRGYRHNDYFQLK